MEAGKIWGFRIQRLNILPGYNLGFPYMGEAMLKSYGLPRSS